MILRTFGWSITVTVLCLLAALTLGGPGALATVAILAILEISLSFDNAVVNATILQRLSPYWQRLFLTVGIVIAVFGMRLVLPLLLVAATARMAPLSVLDLAVHHGEEYAHKLELAHPMIAAFGGTFLLMLFLDYVFTERADTWLTWLERPLARIGRLREASVVVAAVVLSVIGGVFSDDPPGPAVKAAAPVMISGVLGLVTYLVIQGLSERFEHHEPGGRQAVRHGRGALLLFLYLEVLDASFSFDGVIGAFAITSDLFLIAAGLGIGAMYIRSLTVFLVHRGTLAEYVYLEHGAHWAIGALATTMLVGIARPVPDLVSGGIGATVILLSFVSSVIRNRRRKARPSERHELEHLSG